MTPTSAPAELRKRPDIKFLEGVIYKVHSAVSAACVPLQLPQQLALARYICDSAAALEQQLCEIQKNEPFFPDRATAYPAYCSAGCMALYTTSSPRGACSRRYTRYHLRFPPILRPVLYFGLAWSPVSFRYPEFDACDDFDVHTAKPIPYRPFRYRKRF